MTCRASRAPRALEQMREKRLVEDSFGEEGLGEKVEETDEEGADQQVGQSSTRTSDATSPVSCVASPGHTPQNGFNGVAPTRPGEDTVEETEDEEMREDKGTRHNGDEEEEAAAKHMQPQYRNAPCATSTCISLCVEVAYWILRKHRHASLACACAGRRLPARGSQECRQTHR